MTAVAKPKPHPRQPHRGPLHWRHLVDWLSEDGVISPEEARRTIARCSQAESALHPLVRLAAVAMTRASDGKPLDIESLTQYLARRAELE
jgi:general secretion pathway protein E